MKNNSLCKIDINNFYNVSIFESTIYWAKQYNVTQEIDQNISIIEDKKRDYNNEFDDLFKRAQPILDQKFNTYKSIEQKKDFFKRLGIADYIIFFLCIILLGQSVLYSNLILRIFIFLFLIIAFLSMFIGGITAFIFVMKSKKLQKEYNSYVHELECEVHQITAKYENFISALKNTIDNLYLNNLDPAHREIVLMRRDQERQHQERMRIEEKRLRSQQHLEEEQVKARYAQEQLLQIELEREKRYLGKK